MSHSVVILSKEQCGVGAVGRILVEQLVHALQKTLRLIGCNCALAAEACLQISHQKRRGNSLPRNVPHDQPKPLSAQIEEIVIITADFACLEASPRILERCK